MIKRGRPIEYSPEHLQKAREYITKCVDFIPENKELGFKATVKIPSKGGMALYLGVSRDTLYDWASKYEDFSDIMEEMGAKQEEALVNNGLSGNYNPTITKVILTKHGYREGVDTTTNDKDIPTPIINVPRNNSNEENTKSE